MKPSEHVENQERVGTDQEVREEYAVQRAYFLARLQRLVALRDQQVKVTPPDRLALRLLSRALYATYMDCVAAGAGDEAGALLEKAQAQVG